MANTITGLVPTLYQALDIVSRELIGFIPAVTRNSSAERAAKDETITYPVVPVPIVDDITPGLTAPAAADQTIGYASMTISKSRFAPVRWNGEETRALTNAGLYGDIVRDQFAQAMRALVNEIEVDLGALYVNASRAYGTGGTAPFGTAANFTDFAGIQQILDENGAPPTDRHLVLGSGAIANLRGLQSVLFKVNEAGTADLLRDGIIGRVQGLNIHNSAQVAAHTKGAGTGYLINGTTMLAGVKGLIVDTGSGTVLAGDCLTQTSDVNKYIVKTGCTGSGVLITVNNPGLKKALADNLAVTVGTSYAANLCFHRSALQLVTRTPAMPAGGDTADDVTEIVDPVSGLAFQVALYRQYRQIKFEIGIAWGVAATKSEHMAILLG